MCSFPLQRICVIGAGPSGMSFLRQMKELSQGRANPPRVVCYEKQSTPGGQWNYTWRTGTDQYGESVHNSMYKHLWSNAPKEASLEYPDYTFRDHYGQAIPSYLPRQPVLDYLKGRWNKHNLNEFIKYEHVVQHVKYNSEEDNFSVLVKNLPENVQQPPETFDYVVNATGHFSAPFTPNIEGLDSFPGRVLHSHDFRDASQFEGEHLLIIGSSYSAEDIGIQCIKYGANRVTYTYEASPMSYKLPAQMQGKPLVKCIQGKTAFFQDGSSEDFDSVIFATGYLHSYPYLEDSLRLTGPNKLYPDHLYRGTLWLRGGNKRMMYVGAQNQVYSFTMFDAQARWIAKYVLGDLATPSDRQMEGDVAMWVEEESSLTDMHMAVDYQTKYVNVVAAESEYGHSLDASKLLHTWESDRSEDILNYRNKSYKSLFTDEEGAAPADPFMELFNDPLDRTH